MPSLIVTIDTECDKDSSWKTATPLSFRGVLEAIPNVLQPLFESFGVRPTYLLSPEVIANPDSCETLKTLRNVELGTHLHGDYITPSIKTWEPAGSMTDEMQWEYTAAIERDKLATLTELFLQHIGRPPTSFRAGRFGVSQHTGRWLHELGYLVDTSVTPYVVWTSRDGVKRPDFRRCLEHPYFVGKEGDVRRAGYGPLLEVPVTILPPGTLATRSSHDPIWFRPWYSDTEALCRLMRHVRAQQLRGARPRPLVMMFHNVELIPGASPYPQSKAEVNSYLGSLHRVFELALEMGFTFRTLTEYYHDFLKHSPSRDPRNVRRSKLPGPGADASPATCPGLRLPATVVESILESHQVQPWFRYIFRERASRWDVWRPCAWIAERISRDARILSAGCGIGFNLFWLAEQGFRWLDGLDLDESAISAGRAIARQAQLAVSLWVDDGLAPRKLPAYRYDVLEALNWTHLLENFSLDDFLDTYLPFLAEKGHVIIDMIDATYGNLPNSQYHTADQNLSVDARRPSEYRTRLSDSQVRAAFRIHSMEVVKVFREPQIIPKAVYVARRIAPLDAADTCENSSRTSVGSGDTPAEPSSVVTARGAAKGRTPSPSSHWPPLRKPHILLVADVADWIFARHCKMLNHFLCDDFDFTMAIRGENFRESDFDLIYPLEFNLVPRDRIRHPRKYVTGIRSHISWANEDLPRFVGFLESSFQRVHVVSQELLRIFTPRFPTVVYLTHGVDTNFFSPTLPTSQSGVRLRLGWAGNRMNPDKGFEEFIAPLALLPGVELIYCGYADRRLDLTEMRGFYDSLDAYICTSSREGNNNSLLEAAAMQRAIITTDNGTVPEYLQHETNALVVARAATCIFEAVSRLRDDPMLRIQLGERARESVIRRFDWSQWVGPHRTFLREALEGI